MVYRLGFCGSRAEARQFVLHGHFLVNSKKVTIPSYLVKAGDQVTVREKSRKIPRILESLEEIERRGLPAWLELDKKNFIGMIKTLPAREEFTLPMQEQLIVEGGDQQTLPITLRHRDKPTQQRLPVGRAFQLEVDANIRRDEAERLRHEENPFTSKPGGKPGSDV